MMRRFHHGRKRVASLILLTLLMAAMIGGPRAGDLLAASARGAFAAEGRDAAGGGATPAPHGDGEQTELHAETRSDVKALAVPGTPFEGDDPRLALAWQRGGCQVNPGNPSCVLLGVAVACEREPSEPGCRADHDGDACLDVAEALAGLDPFQPADCVGGRNGNPALNCLFLTFHLTCHGRGRAMVMATPESGAAGGAARVELTPAPAPDGDCPLLARDPACDGFAPNAK